VTLDDARQISYQQADLAWLIAFTELLIAGFVMNCADFNR